MRKWIREQKTIEDLYDMYKRGDLQLQPFFQRNLVWTAKSKSLFIESILLDLPISEVYLHEDETGLLSVIDGQQRLSTIFHFIDKEFVLTDLEKLESLNGEDSSFSEIKKFMAFEIYYVKIKREASQEEIIDTYSRINTNTVNLNKQELRRAIFHDSNFLKLSEELSQLEFFQYGRFFTDRKRDRMNDVEYLSELLAYQMDGIQDKKSKLDDFYRTSFPSESYTEKKELFIFILEDIEKVFNFPQYFEQTKPKYDGSNSAKNLSTTRYKQQADFYSLFSLFKALREEGIVLTLEQEEKFLKLLLTYDYLIEPEADIDLLSKYAIKCVSQGNTKNSRMFRYEFLRNSLNYIILESDNAFIIELKKDFKEVFDYTFEPLTIDLDDLYGYIQKFYEEIEEDD